MTPAEYVQNQLVQGFVQRYQQHNQLSVRLQNQAEIVSPDSSFVWMSIPPLLERYSRYIFAWFNYQVVS